MSNVYSAIGASQFCINGNLSVHQLFLHHFQQKPDTDVHLLGLLRVKLEKILIKLPDIPQTTLTWGQT